MASSSSPDGLPSASPPPGRVLVVDDERAIAELLSSSLARRGFATLPAYTAETAKQLLAEHPDILVLLTDIRMPGQDGLSLAGEVLANRPEQQAVEVLLLTGYASTETALDALRTHVFDLVQKPFDLGALAQTLAAAQASAQERRRRAGHNHRLQQQIAAATEERDRLLARLDASSAATAAATQARAVSERTRSDLLAVVSHELRTPLIPVIGLAELLLHTPHLPHAEILDCARTILDSGQRLLAMIDGALDIVAMDQGLRAMEHRRFHVADLAARIAARHHAAGDDARPVRVLSAGDAATTATGDFRLLERALEHLVTNAIAATPPDTEVSITWHDQAGALCLAVTDAGAGIAPDVMANLGRPFVQADMSRGRRWPGAGLGLAFVHRVAAAHGGRLSLHPAHPTGTRAELLLPGAPA